MKTVGAINLGLFLLAALTASGVAAQSGLSVLDAKGDPLMADVPYYIKAVQQPGRWLSRHRTDAVASDWPCPENLVVSGPTAVVPRVAVIFVSNTHLIFESGFDSINFVSSNHCGESGIWAVQSTLAPLVPREVLLNGTRLTDATLFTIERLGVNYKLVFDTSKPDGSTDLGFIVDEAGIKRMVVGSPLGPLEVSFVRP